MNQYPDPFTPQNQHRAIGFLIGFWVVVLIIFVSLINFLI